jgi:hypothetical protein
VIYPNPRVFVVGCPRSGTTLLQRMLDSHPRLAVANDTHFVPAAVEGMAPDPALPLTPEIVERVRRYRTRAGKGFDRLELPTDALDRAAASARTYSELVTALYSEFAALRGKPFAGEKTPDYVRHLPLLRALFPWAKVVHLVRDGRDVSLALLEWAQDGKGPGRLKLWHENPTATCALWWHWQVSSGRRDAAVYGSAYHEVRYETLVATPEETLRELADFLELPFDDRMLAYHLGRTRTKPGLPTNKAWLPPTPGVRDWRAQMPRHDVELVEALVGDLLDDLGYERAFLTISPSVRADANRYRDWWARKLARRAANDRHPRAAEAAPVPPGAP